MSRQTTLDAHISPTAPIYRARRVTPPPPDSGESEGEYALQSIQLAPRPELPRQIDLTWSERRRLKRQVIDVDDGQSELDDAVGMGEEAYKRTPKKKKRRRGPHRELDADEALASYPSGVEKSDSEKDPEGNDSGDDEFVDALSGVASRQVTPILRLRQRYAVAENASPPPHKTQTYFIPSDSEEPIVPSSQVNQPARNNMSQRPFESLASETEPSSPRPRGPRKANGAVAVRSFPRQNLSVEITTPVGFKREAYTPVDSRLAPIPSSSRLQAALGAQGTAPAAAETRIRISTADLEDDHLNCALSIGPSRSREDFATVAAALPSTEVAAMPSAAPRTPERYSDGGMDDELLMSVAKTDPVLAAFESQGDPQQQSSSAAPESPIARRRVKREVAHVAPLSSGSESSVPVFKTRYEIGQAGPSRLSAAAQSKVLALARRKRNAERDKAARSQRPVREDTIDDFIVNDVTDSEYGEQPSPKPAKTRSTARPGPSSTSTAKGKQRADEADDSDAHDILDFSTMLRQQPSPAKQPSRRAEPAKPAGKTADIAKTGLEEDTDASDLYEPRSPQRHRAAQSRKAPAKKGGRRLADAEAQLEPRRKVAKSKAKGNARNGKWNKSQTTEEETEDEIMAPSLSRRRSIASRGQVQARKSKRKPPDPTSEEGEEKEDEEQEDEEEEFAEIPTKRRRPSSTQKARIRRARDPDEERSEAAATESEEDVVRELDLDEPQRFEAATRLRERKETAFQSRLRKLKEARSAARQTSPVSVETFDSGENEADEVIVVSDDGSSWIEDVGDEFDSALIPYQLSKDSRQSPEYTFKVVFQYMLLLVISGPGILPMDEDNERYFIRPLEDLRRRMDGYRTSVVKSQIWGSAFTDAVEALPFMMTTTLDELMDGCEACGRNHHKSRFFITLSGVRYDRATYEDLSEDDDDDSNIGAVDNELRHTFHLGRQCHARTVVFHNYIHWEYHLHRRILNIYNDLKRATGRYVSDSETDIDSDDGDGEEHKQQKRRLKERDRQYSRDRVRLMKEQGPPRDIEDVNDVMEWLDLKKYIVEMFADHQRLEESAQDLEKMRFPKDD